MSEIFVDWHLVRHAPVAGVREGIYRSIDPEADLSDEPAIRSTAELLPPEARWWMSPMRRTRQTADALSRRAIPCAPPTLDDRLREQSFGTWHGLTFQELWPRIRSLPTHNWSYLAPESTPPEGESYLALWNRVAGYLEEAERSLDETPRVLVTHAGVIRAIVGQGLGLTPARALALSLDHLSVTKLTQRTGGSAADDERGGDWQLRYLNRLSTGPTRTVPRGP